MALIFINMIREIIDDITFVCSSPINQISFGISNLLSNNAPMYKSAPVRQISYSSIAKKEPLQPMKPVNNIPSSAANKPTTVRNINNKTDTKKFASNPVSTKVTETAISAGYRFKARNPEPDPRYPSDQQLMVGPIPGRYPMHLKVWLTKIFLLEGRLSFEQRVRLVSQTLHYL